MANVLHCIYSPHISPSSNASADPVCSCQAGNCSRGRRSKGSIPIGNNMFLIIMLSISYFTCCVSAWPIMNYQRNYYPSVLIPNNDMDISQWAVAAQPEQYEQENIYDETLAAPVQDIYDDQFYEELGELYNSPDLYQAVETEPEVELENLKYQQPYAYTTLEKTHAVPKISTPSGSSLPSSTPKPTESPLELKSPTASALTSNTKKAQPAAVHSGQKEIAMLRPPSAKSHHMQIGEAEEPKISVAQRSPSNEKPSAYDTLRKYLSIDDALKKEYQQRRANSNRHTKRESAIITDSESLSGQLNSLKKKVD